MVLSHYTMCLLSCCSNSRHQVNATQNAHWSQSVLALIHLHLFLLHLIIIKIILHSSIADIHIQLSRSDRCYSSRNACEPLSWRNAPMC